VDVSGKTRKITRSSLAGPTGGIAGELPVVIVVAFHHNLQAFIPAHELEGAGTNRVFREELVAHSLHIVLGHDEVMGEKRDESGVGHGGDELHREAIQGHRVGHRIQKALAEWCGLPSPCAPQ